MANAGTGQAGQADQQTKANNVYDFLQPKLQGDVDNPQGYSPQQLAYMNTASQQSLGGSTAGITGQANLTAARTRNAGGFQSAIGSGSREAMRNLSQNALQIQGKQADLQQQQRQQALQALQQLYGINEQQALGYLNSSNSALNAENQGSKNTFGSILKGLGGLGTGIGDVITAEKA